MIITYFPIRVHRFDIVEKQLNQPLKLTVTCNVMHGMDQGQLWIGLEWRINMLDSINFEVVGYLAEHRAIVIIEDKIKDKESIETFATNSFLNIQIAFQEKLRPSYNIFSHTQPDLEKISSSILKRLDDDGLY